MRKVTDSVLPNGIFVGQLFGVDDGWNTSGTMMNFHKRADIDTLFRDFKKLHVSEVNESGFIADGSPKHWHVFNIIAQK